MNAKEIKESLFWEKTSSNVFYSGVNCAMFDLSDADVMDVLESVPVYLVHDFYSGYCAELLEAEAEAIVLAKKFEADEIEAHKMNEFFIAYAALDESYREYLEINDYIAYPE